MCWDNSDDELIKHLASQYGVCSYHLMMLLTGKKEGIEQTLVGAWKLETTSLFLACHFNDNRWHWFWTRKVFTKSLPYATIPI